MESNVVGVGLGAAAVDAAAVTEAAGGDQLALRFPGLVEGEVEEDLEVGVEHHADVELQVAELRGWKIEVPCFRLSYLPTMKLSYNWNYLGR